jgi:hypothetical protein
MKKKINDNKKPFRSLSNNYEVFVGNEYSSELLIPKKKRIIGKKVKKKIIINIRKKTAIVSSNVTLNEVNQKAKKYDLYLPISPGNMDITIAGAISNNVHGKNSYKQGNFLSITNKIKVIRNNKIIEIKSKEEKSYIVGGMGLFGQIIGANVKLTKKPNFISYQTFTFNSYANLKKYSNMTNKYDEFTAWINLTDRCFEGFVLFGKNIYNKKVIKKKTINFMRIFSPIVSYFLNKLISIVGIRLFISNYFFRYINILVFNLGKLMLKKNFLLNTDSQIGANKHFDIKNLKNKTTEFQLLINTKNFDRFIKSYLNVMKKYKIVNYWTILKKHKKDNAKISFSDNGFSISLIFHDELYEKQFFSRDIYNIIRKFKCKVYLPKLKKCDKKLMNLAYPNFKKFMSIVLRYNKAANKHPLYELR